jgi:hypothetical protein
LPFNDENQLASVSVSGSTVTSYTYGADGSRARKSNVDGTYTEYVYLGGQPMAEHHSDNTWTDYIYANGKQTAQISPTSHRLHMQGTTIQTGGEHLPETQISCLVSVVAESPGSSTSSQSSALCTLPSRSFTARQRRLYEVDGVIDLR